MTLVQQPLRFRISAAILLTCILPAMQSPAQRLVDGDPLTGAQAAQLTAAYQHAFHAFAVLNEQATGVEYKGESGAAISDRFMTQLGVTPIAYAQFRKAALDYRQAELSAQSKIDAIRIKGLDARERIAPPAKVLIRATVVEFKQKTAEAVASVRSMLDVTTLQELDQAVANWYLSAQTGESGTNGHTGILTLLRPKSNTALLPGPIIRPDLGVKIYDPGGPDDGCSELDVNEETEFSADCLDNGGDFDLDYCTCDDPGGDGGGGSVPPPEVTIIAWVNGAAVSLPGGANSLLQAVLQNGNSVQIALCAQQVGGWTVGNRGYVVTSIDQAYASGWLLQNSANMPPPPVIVPAVVMAAGDYRLFNDTSYGIVVGSTPDPCKTGQITGWYPTLPGEVSTYNGNTGISPTSQVYQMNEGRVGLVGQAANLTLNGLTTPWIWSVIEFNIWGEFTGNLHAMFPTYSVYVNNDFLTAYPQSDDMTFIDQGGSYQLTPAQIP